MSESAPDAVLVPGGGVSETGELPPWVITRLDRALQIADGAPIITLSAGTPHRPRVPVFESVAGANYLLGRGYPRESILTETASYDTIGNAWFARTIHTDPAGFHNLCIVTSDFHMPRTTAIFRWIFGPPYRLLFESTPADGMSPEIWQSRVDKEKLSLNALQPRIAELTSLRAIHKWLYSGHDLYATGLSYRPPCDPALLRSY